MGIIPGLVFAGQFRTTPKAAAGRIGEHVEVDGYVSQVIFKSGNAYLNFDAEFPNQSFTGFVGKLTVTEIGEATLRSLEGMTVQITGQVATFNGKPEIRVTTVSQLAVDGAPLPSRWRSPKFWTALLMIGGFFLGCRLLNWMRRVKKLNGRVNFVQAVVDNEWPGLVAASKAWEQLLSQQKYICKSEFANWLVEHGSLVGELPPEVIERLPNRACVSTVESVFAARRNGLQIITDKNARFVAQETKEWRQLFDTVEKNPLTSAQRDAVVTDDDYTLVLAGAGTGKTSTIVAKVVYLLRKGLAVESEILLLAYTEKAAKELESRINKTVGGEISVKTFHSLGSSIIREHGRCSNRNGLNVTENYTLSVCKEAGDPHARRTLISNLVNELIDEDDRFAWAYLKFQAEHRFPYQSAWTFTSLEDYYAYVNAFELRTLKCEKVKSHEELRIANWLTMNGIQYIYEAKYERATATERYRQYHPDFFLPEYQIYIEHFGVDEKGNPPSYYSQKEKDDYLNGMAWKRTVHARFGSVLVETFSWQFRDGSIFRHLESLLLANDVHFELVDPRELLSDINESGIIETTCDLFVEFLSLFKGSCLARQELLRRAGDDERNRSFCDIFLSVLDRYEATLADRGEIDFDDMIRRACDCVETRSWRSPFRYIVVDEFQDIAVGRAKLIKALQSQHPNGKLFCVGDDWQSIYRFAGSDLSCIADFAGHFGPASLCALDRTFRFSEELVKVSTGFVTKNPVQIAKTMTANFGLGEPAVYIHLSTDQNSTLNRVLANIAGRCSSSKTVLILARYSFQLPMGPQINAWKRRFRRLKIDALTIHKSKGLEADFVIICGMTRGKFGFPSQMEDDPVLRMVLSHPDEYPHGEERRIFYVALTRAKERVEIWADEDNPSEFITELRDDPMVQVISSK